MHGLIFETSVWLLAGSTRLISNILFVPPTKVRVLQRKQWGMPKQSTMYSSRINNNLQFSRNNVISVNESNQNAKQILFTEIVVLEQQCSTNLTYTKIHSKQFTMSSFVVLIWSYSQHSTESGTNTSEQYWIINDNCTTTHSRKSTTPMRFHSRIKQVLCTHTITPPTGDHRQAATS